MNSNMKSSGIGGTSASKTAASGILSRIVNERVTNALFELVQEKRFTLDSLILLVLEVIPLLSIPLLVASQFLLPNSDSLRYGSHAFFLLNPTISSINENYYIWMSIFIVACLFVVTNLGCLLSVIYFKTTNHFFLTLVSLMFRLQRTVLFFPTMFVLLSPFQCHMFNGSEVEHHHLGTKCFQLPNLMFQIFGSMLILVVVLICSFDVIFLVDTFRSIHLATASPDGRFSFLMFLFNVVTVFVFQFTSVQEEIIGVIIGDVFMIILGTVVLLLLLRFVPFYKKKYVFIIAMCYTLTISLRITSIVLYATQSYFSMIVLVLNLPLCVIVAIVLLIRYILMWLYFRKKRFTTNFFLCYFSWDIAIGLYLVKKKKKSGVCFSLCKSKVHDKTFIHKSNGLTKTILDIMEDSSFSKSKSICQMLIPLVIDENIHLASNIVKHTRTIPGSAFADVEIALQLYRRKVSGSQQVSTCGKKVLQRKNRYIRTLEIAKRHENDMELLYILLFEKLGTEDRKVSFKSFSRIFTMIQEHQEFCEKTYSSVIRDHPNPVTFRRYANFVGKFLNNHKLAEVYLREAENLEQAFHANTSNSAFMGRTGPANQIIPRPQSSSQSQNSNLEKGELQGSVTTNQDTSISSSTPKIEIDVDDFSNIVVTEDDNEEDVEIRPPNSVNSDYGKPNELALSGCESSTSSIKDYDSEHLLDDDVKRNSDDERKSDKSCEQSVKDEKEEELVPASLEDLTLNTDKRSEDNQDVDDIGHQVQVGTATAMLMDDMHSIQESNQSRSSFTKNESKLRKKLNKQRFLTVEFLRVTCCVVFLVSVTCIIMVFVFGMLMEYRMNDSGEMMELASRIRKSGVASAHFLRKLQISSYETEEQTYFCHEKEVESFRRRTYKNCRRFRTRLQALYMNLGKLGKLEFQKKLRFVEKIRDGEFIFKQMTLLDGITDYSQRCMNILDLSDSDYRNRTVGHRLEDNDDFVMVTLNEPYVYDGLQDVLMVMMEEFEGQFSVLTFLFCFFPYLLLLLIPFVCVGYCCYCCKLQRSYKALLLIPTDEIDRISKKFGKKDGDDNYENKVRLSKCSLAQKFLVMQICSIIVLVLVLAPFTALGATAATETVDRNREYDYALRIAVTVHRIHLWAVELVYRDDTLFPTDEIVEGIKMDMSNLERRYENLRFGNEKLKLKGNDDNKKLYPIYYIDSCGSEGKFDGEAGHAEHEHGVDDEGAEELEAFEKISCMSLNDKVALMVRSAGSLLETNFTNRLIARRSLHYEAIIFLDNISTKNLTLDDTGAIQHSLRDLEEVIAHEADTPLVVLLAFSYFLIIVVLPVFVIIYCLSFYTFPGRLGRTLTYSRRVLLFLDKDLLQETVLMNYVSGRNSKGFKTTFETTRKNRLERMMDILDTSNFSVLVFTKKGTIVRFNQSAELMFKISSGEKKNMKNILDEKSFQKVGKWMGGNNSSNIVKGKDVINNNEDNIRSLSTSLNGIYEGELIPISADLSCDNKLCIGIFENVETSRKKDQLINNFLPKEVAMKLDIDEIGNKPYIESHKVATAFFCDICNFSSMTNELGSEKLVHVLHKFVTSIDAILVTYDMEKIKTIGDAYFAVSGIPTYSIHHGKNAMEFSIKVLEICKQLKLVVRIGLSSGPLVAGIIGKKKWVYDCWGNTVNEAARMEKYGVPGRIMCSRSTYELVFEDYPFMMRRMNVQGIGVVKAYIYNQDNLGSTSLESLSSFGEINRKKLEEQEEEGEGEDDENDENLKKEESSSSSSSSSSDDDNDDNEQKEEELEFVKYKENVKEIVEEKVIISEKVLVEEIIDDEEKDEKKEICLESDLINFKTTEEKSIINKKDEKSTSGCDDDDNDDDVPKIKESSSLKKLKKSEFVEIELKDFQDDELEKEEEKEENVVVVVKEKEEKEEIVVVQKLEKEEKEKEKEEDEEVILQTLEKEEEISNNNNNNEDMEDQELVEEVKEEEENSTNNKKDEVVEEEKKDDVEVVEVVDKETDGK